MTEDDENAWRANAWQGFLRLPVGVRDALHAGAMPQSAFDAGWDAHDEDALGDMRAVVETLKDAVVGQRIVSVHEGSGRWGDRALILTLNSGHQVEIEDTDDCCAFTALERLRVGEQGALDHVITDVTANESCSTWSIMAGAYEALGLDVNWSEGNYPYYMVGFTIRTRQAALVGQPTEGE